MKDFVKNPDKSSYDKFYPRAQLPIQLVSRNIVRGES